MEWGWDENYIQFTCRSFCWLFIKNQYESVIVYLYPSVFHSMIKFLKGFLIMISLYFVVHTIVVFGLLDGHYKEIISGLKELIWIGFVGLAALRHWKQTKEYISRTKRMSLSLLGLMVAWVLVTIFVQGITMATLKDSIIWLKYGWYFMVIFWSAWLIGYLLSTPTISTWGGDRQARSVDDWIRFIVRLSWFILVVGFVVQGSKVLFSDLWYWLGFGPLNIYKAWVAPPLYYLTQQGGVMRYSWLFSGPNNFAFWFIGLMPLLWAESWKAEKLKGFFKRAVLLLFAGLNLGRALLVGLFTQAMIGITQQSWIKKHLFRVWLGLGVIVGLFGYITYLKRESTTEHFALGLDALHKFFINPRWYGLGSSGPGIHRHGSLLPENYYLQLALDYGFWWPIGFVWFWMSTLMLIKHARNDSKGPEKESLHYYNNLFLMGFVGLLIAGMFLHVFEDSMVNYLFFVAWGIVFGRMLKR